MSRQIRLRRYAANPGAKKRNYHQIFGESTEKRLSAKLKTGIYRGHRSLRIAADSKSVPRFLSRRPNHLAPNRLQVFSRAARRPAEAALRDRTFGSCRSSNSRLRAYDANRWCMLCLRRLRF